jgi:hypothetical protein
MDMCLLLYAETLACILVLMLLVAQCRRNLQCLLTSKVFDVREGEIGVRELCCDFQHARRSNMTWKNRNSGLVRLGSRETLRTSRRPLRLFLKLKSAQGRVSGYFPMEFVYIVMLLSDAPGGRRNYRGDGKRRTKELSMRAFFVFFDFETFKTRFAGQLLQGCYLINASTGHGT